MKCTWICLIGVALLAGCVSPGPAMSKAELGSLEINVFGPQNASVRVADIYVDGLFIGNATAQRPILYIKRGERKVRVELAGYKPYERTIHLFGDPNHQVLNILMEPIAQEKQPTEKP